jgi:hypothetical protein
MIVSTDRQEIDSKPFIAIGLAHPISLKLARLFAAWQVTWLSIDIP